MLPPPLTTEASSHGTVKRSAGLSQQTASIA
jgi:hypothetical protein